MENKYIFKKIFKKEKPETKKQNRENINFLMCESFIKGRNKHKYLINDNQKKIFKNQLYKSCIFLDEKDENLQNEENKLSIINIYNNRKNKKKILPLIKQNENLNTNTLNILNSKNYCIDDKIKEEQVIKDIEINNHDFKKDLNNEAKDDHNEININNKDLNDDDQQLLKIIRFLQNMKYYNSNDKNNINKILNIYLKQSINSFSNIINFLYLNRLYNIFQK